MEIVAEVPSRPFASDVHARMAKALKTVRLAERLLQIHTDDDSVRLFDLSPRDRARYADAAAVALALLETEPQRPAIYVAAHRLVDLGTQTPTQRFGLVQMVTQLVERYLEVLAGHHTQTVDSLAPLVALDRAAAERVPEGVM